MFCKKCGGQNDEGVKFCTFCGAPMEEDSTVTPAQPMGQPMDQSGEMPGANNGMPGPMNGAPGQPPMGQPGGQFSAANGMPGGIPGPMNGAPGQPPMGQPGGQFSAANGMPGGMPGAMPGAPGQPMGQPQPGVYAGAPGNMPGGAPNGMQGMPGARPMQSGPMYQMPPMQAIPPAQPKKSGGAVKAVIIVIVVLLLLCVGILAAIGFSKSAKQKKINGYIETAEQSRKDEKYQAAINSYQDALEMDERNEDALEGLTDTYVEWANSLADDGDYEEALEVLESADSRADKKTIKAAKEDIEAAKTGLSAKDFVVTGSRDIEVTLNTVLFIEDNWTLIGDIITYDSEQFDEDFATSRGLKLGMSLSDYEKLYPVEEGYALWEVFDADGYTDGVYYTGQDVRELYEDFVDIWLDLAWVKEDGKWKLLSNNEVGNIWFCEASFSKYDEIMFLSVNIDPSEKIQCIYMYHVNYDDDWVAFQDW